MATVAVGGTAAATAATAAAITAAFLVPLIKELAPVVIQTIVDLINNTIGDEQVRARAIQLGIDVANKSTKYTRDALAKYVTAAITKAAALSTTKLANTADSISLGKRLFTSTSASKAATVAMPTPSVASPDMALQAITKAAYGGVRKGRKAPARARRTMTKLSYGGSDTTSKYLPAFSGKYGCGKMSY